MVFTLRRLNLSGEAPWGASPVLFFVVCVLAHRRGDGIPSAVSLNRSEDALLQYLRSHPDEQRFWHARVLAIAGESLPAEARAAQLERALRAYASERAQSDPEQGEALGAGRVSLRNLAEYLLRAWPPPRPPKAAGSARS